MFCRAICLGAWRDGGRDGLAGVTWLSGMGGDIGLHLRALQDKYRLWTKDVLSEERRALDEMAYQFNEWRLVEDCFPAEEVALIPATLQELLTLNKFPDFKPFDQYKYPLISIGKDQGEQEEQGSFILRWPDDFR
jgi:hypothetical protein